MALRFLRSYRLVEAEIWNFEIDWKKTAKKSVPVLRKACVELVFRSLLDPSSNPVKVQDVMSAVGSGAFKDAYVMESYPLVVKMMLRERHVSAWGNGVAEEEQRSDINSR